MILSKIQEISKQQKQALTFSLRLIRPPKKVLFLFGQPQSGKTTLRAYLYGQKILFQMNQETAIVSLKTQNQYLSENQNDVFIFQFPRFQKISKIQRKIYLFVLQQVLKQCQCYFLLVIPSHSYIQQCSYVINEFVETFYGQIQKNQPIKQQQIIQSIKIFRNINICITGGEGYQLSQLQKDNETIKQNLSQFNLQIFNQIWKQKLFIQFKAENPIRQKGVILLTQLTSLPVSEKYYVFNPLKANIQKENIKIDQLKIYINQYKNNLKQRNKHQIIQLLNYYLSSNIQNNQKKQIFQQPPNKITLQELFNQLQQQFKIQQKSKNTFEIKQLIMKISQILLIHNLFFQAIAINMIIPDYLAIEQILEILINYSQKLPQKNETFPQIILLNLKALSIKTLRKVIQQYTVILIQEINKRNITPIKQNNQNEEQNIKNNKKQEKKIIFIQDQYCSYQNFKNLFYNYKDVLFKKCQENQKGDLNRYLKLQNLAYTFYHFQVDLTVQK